MKAFRIPIFTLLLLLFICLYAGKCVTAHTDIWQEQLNLISDAVEQEDWNSASENLSALYTNWQAQQGWLHLIIAHAELDETEALLQRCAVLTQQQISDELTADLAELRSQFQLLDEMQRLTLRNIL